MHTSLFQWWHNHQRKSYLWWLQHQRYELITSNNMIVTRFLDFFLMWEIETPLICFFYWGKQSKTFRDLFFYLEKTMKTGFFGQMFFSGKTSKNNGYKTSLFFCWENKQKPIRVLWALWHHCRPMRPSFCNFTHRK